MKNSKDKRHGSPEFYSLLDEMASLHGKKAHDYANEADPVGNYRFSGILSKLFDSPDDSGFVSRFGEKLYRLANIENSGKTPLNETVEENELDILVIITLWISDRRERRRLLSSTGRSKSL